MKRLVCLGLLLLLVTPQTGLCLFGVGDIVLDPTNLIQNTFTAYRSLQSNVNEVLQINNQIRSLANEARNLANMPLSVIDDIQRTMTVYTGLLNQGRGIAYQAKASLDSFDRLFGKGQGGWLQRSQAVMNEVRNTARLATEIQSIYDMLCATTSRVERLTLASQAAVGQLQATQAGNQLLAVAAGQQQGLYQLQAVTSRLQTMEYMNTLMHHEQARLNAEAWLADWNSTPPRKPGQGRGPTLP